MSFLQLSSYPSLAFSTAPLKNVKRKSFLDSLGSAAYAATGLLCPLGGSFSVVAATFPWGLLVSSHFVASISDRPISHLLRIFNTRHFAVLKSVLLCQLIYIIEQFPMLLTTSLVFNVTINFINDHLYLLLNTNCTAALKWDRYLHLNLCRKIYQFYNFNPFSVNFVA